MTGKEVKYPHQKEYLSPELLQAHLEGKITVGVMLLQPMSNTAKAGVIDIDIPRDAPNLSQALDLAIKIQQQAFIHGLQAYIEFSGNRGFHVWVFSQSPLPGATWIQALQNMAQLADFTAKEVFPNHELTESKCIKLPCGIHLKSNRRCGFISVLPQPTSHSLAHKTDMEFDEQGYPILPEQESLMASFVQNNPEAIALLATRASSAVINKPLTVSHQPLAINHQSSTQNKTTTADFSGFHPNEHPGCINSLISNGAPLSLDYNAVNLTLARYALTRNLTEAEAVKIASLVAEATSENHPTSKDAQGKVTNFKSVYKSAKRKNYSWECSFALSGVDTHDTLALTERGCLGEKCSVWNYAHKPFSDSQHPSQKSSLNVSIKQPPQKSLLNASIWQAMIHLVNRGLEMRISTLLSALESIKLSEVDLPWQATPADEATEFEVLAYILQLPDALTEALAADIVVEGFVSKTAENLVDYLNRLFVAPLPQPQTFTAHLARISETGIRVLTAKHTSETESKSKQRDVAIADSLDLLITQSRNLLRRTSSDVLQMNAYSADLMHDLFTKPEIAISTPSQWLNNALNGGLAPYKFYVIAAPPGNGKTTFCNWCGDYAASHQIPVLVVAYEMSRYQLWVYSLARLEGINSALIERKAWLENLEYERDVGVDGNQYQQENLEMLFTRLMRVAKQYHANLAPYLTILEAGPEHTAARLKGVIASVRHNAKLDESAPVLVIIDYLQLMLSGDEFLDNASVETLRISRIATSLKQLARDTGTAVIAISDITKAAYQQALSTGSLDMSALRDSFKIAHAADVIMLLQTGQITVGKGNNIQTMDQLSLAAQKYSNEKQRLIERVRVNYPLSTSSKDTYARLSILKNRGGRLAEPLFIYQKALHRFQSIDLDLGGFDDEDSL